MCGVSGLWTPGGAPRAFLEDTAARMADRLTHRGPDGRGIYADPEAGLALGHTRLAILDLTDAGAQPMATPQGRFVLCFNGEIYNHLALRDRLEREGHVPDGGWRGRSDTETLLHACKAWGVASAVQASAGMFALAFWDREARVLTLARDRYGKKPLYYGYVGDTLIFGSQLAALRRHPDWDRPIDPRALDLYLRRLYVPDPLCIHQGIAKLSPAHLLRIDEMQLHARDMGEPERWWSVAGIMRQRESTPFPDLETDEGAWALEEALRRAVRERLAADVPVGVLLSGGIDSSLVAALAQQEHGDAPIRTFTVAAPGREYDESAPARAVAEHLGTEHTELRVDADAALAVLPNLPRVWDEPFADSSQIPTYCISALAREHVTVCLTGDGGDEIFAGYNRHLTAPGLWRSFSTLPLPARRVLAWAMRHGGSSATHLAHDLLRPLLPPSRRPLLFRHKLAKVVAGMDSPNFETFYSRIASTWHTPPLARDMTVNLVDERGLSDETITPPEHFPARDHLAWMLAMDQTTYLPGDILTKVDRASMAHGLECRAPLLDHRVSALAWTGPVSRHVRHGKGKQLLRAILSRHMPAQLFDRPKQGFSVPVAHWLRTELRDWAEGLLDRDRLAREGYFAPDAVRRVWTDFLAARTPGLHPHIWAVCMFQAWLDEYPDAR